MDSNKRIDSQRYISGESSYQLPSEPRRSVLSWPTTAVLGAPDQNVESYPSALVPYQVPPEGESPSSISPTREAMAIDSAWDISRTSSLQLPSEPRRSVLSWPTAAMLEEPDENVESSPSALVPYQLLPEQMWPSSTPWTDSERGTLTIYSERLSLSPDVRRSTLSLPSSNPPSGMRLLQGSDQAGGLLEGMGLSGTSQLSIEPAPPSLSRQSEQIDLPPEPRRSVDSLFLSYMSVDSPASSSQMDAISPSPGQFEQPKLSAGAESSSASEVDLPQEARRSIGSLSALPTSPLARDKQTELPTQPVAIDWPSHTTHLPDQSQDTQTPIGPPPPDTGESQEPPADESDDVVLLNTPPAITFRFFEYNGTSLTPMWRVSRANMEIYLATRRNWIWFKRDGS
jgi:hypothetical protein